MERTRMTGKEIKAIRQMLGLTQRQFGTALGLEVNDVGQCKPIIRYELGENPVPHVLARFIGVILKSREARTLLDIRAPDDPIDDRPAGIRPRGFSSETSSTIREVVHDGNATMHVRFVDGTVYEYVGVPVAVMAEFESAASPGHYHALTIKRSYDYRKLPPEEAAVVDFGLSSMKDVDVEDPGLAIDGPDDELPQDD